MGVVIKLRESIYLLKQSHSLCTLFLPGTCMFTAVYHYRHISLSLAIRADPCTLDYGYAYAANVFAHRMNSKHIKLK